VWQKSLGHEPSASSGFILLERCDVAIDLFSIFDVKLVHELPILSIRGCKEGGSMILFFG
jgi:hypothetical protein